METTIQGLSAHKGLRGEILLELKRAQPMTARDLAEKLGVSANAVRHHLKELGSRIPAPADRVGRQREPDGGDAGECEGGPPVRSEAGLRGRAFPEEIERALVERIEKSLRVRGEVGSVVAWPLIEHAPSVSTWSTKNTVDGSRIETGSQMAVDLRHRQWAAKSPEPPSAVPEKRWNSLIELQRSSPGVLRLEHPNNNRKG